MDTQAGPLETSVRAALGALDPDATDAGATALATTYARAIDDGADLERIGPLLLACLESLHMTPKARQAAVKGGTSDRQAASPLDELRSRRTRRNRAANLDATVP